MLKEGILVYVEELREIGKIISVEKGDKKELKSVKIEVGKDRELKEFSGEELDKISTTFLVLVRFWKSE